MVHLEGMTISQDLSRQELGQLLWRGRGEAGAARPAWYVPWPGRRVVALGTTATRLPVPVFASPGLSREARGTMLTSYKEEGRNEHICHAHYPMPVLSSKGPRVPLQPLNHSQ